MVEPPLCPICRTSVELDIPAREFRMSGVFLSCPNIECDWCLDSRENVPSPYQFKKAINAPLPPPPAPSTPQAVVAFDGFYWATPWLAVGILGGLLLLFL